MNSGPDGSEPALEPGYMSLLLSNSSKRQVFLIGTAHVSNVSAAQVRSAISAVAPDGVMVELCAARAQKLRSAAYSQQDFTKTLLNLMKRRSDPLIGMFATQEMFRLLGLVPGVDFKAALDECDARGIPVINGDINVSTTMDGLRREMASLDMSNLYERMGRYQMTMTAAEQDKVTSTAMGLMGAMVKPGGVEKLVESLKDREQISLMRDLVSAGSPGLMEVLLHERDRHMANNLINWCGNAERIVAVVGMAHMDGIEKLWRLDGGTVLHMGNPDHT